MTDDVEEKAAEAAEETVAEAPAAEAEAPKPKAKAKVEKSAKGGSIDSILEAIKGMTVLELAELVKTLEDEFGAFRLVYISFPVYLLPEGPAAQLVENAASWLLSP